MDISGGSPVPYIAGSGATANFAHANTAAVISPTASFNLGIQPNDGNTHKLISASMTMSIAALSVTGVAVASFALVDHAATTTYLDLELYASGTPASDAMPSRTVSLAWPGGVPITSQSSPTTQLQLVMDINAVSPGTLSSWAVYGSCCYTWS